jgi:hypothetical protein
VAGEEDEHEEQDEHDEHEEHDEHDTQIEWQTHTHKIHTDFPRWPDSPTQ